MPFSAYIMLRFKGWTSELFPSCPGSQVLRFHSFCSEYLYWMEQWVRGWGVKSNESLKDVNEFPDHCLYDVIPRAFGNIMASKHIANTSVADCQDKCENYVTEDGHRCLGFNFNDVIQTCGLMTGENLFRLDKHHRPSPVHRLFIRRCEIQGIKSSYDIVTVLNKIIHVLQTLHISLICLVYSS